MTQASALDTISSNSKPGNMANLPAANGGDKMAMAKKGTIDLEVRAPPLPKITQGFIPMSLLLKRLVQDSFNELQLMVEGISSPGMSSEEKKARIMKYATATRKEFIKLLVLAMWANDAAAVSDVIDLKAWLDNQFRVFDGVVEVLRSIRTATGRARIPNPDLATAVEVLSTGHPTTGMMNRYVPPPPLTPAEILKILKNINAQLAIRLGIHETLPPHFRNYTIASGRATFVAKDEFEIDLSVGDESPDSQLYVIDVRILFEPAIRPIPPAIFRELEARGNQVLATKGLEGIYDFLHDYFLTTKIMTLFRQASEMLGGRWTENLKIQQHRRTLVIQYWPHKPGEKSWIEVGVKRGVNNGPSRLGVRWMRDGTEMKDVEVPLDVANLSASTLIKTVIAMHTKHILETLRSKLFESPLLAAPGVVTLATHPTESFECYLTIQLTPSRELKVLLEPVTGRYALQKQSERAAKIEFDMNSRGNSSPHDLLLRFKYIAMQDEVEHRAKSMGWEILKSLSIRSEELKRDFPANSRYMLYMRRKGWCKNWIITFVQQDTGESWWATEIAEKQTQWSIIAASKIPTKGPMDVTYRFLENLEKMAAGFISHYVNSRQLQRQGTLHQFAPSKAMGIAHSSGLQVPDLYVRFSSLIKASWGIDVLRISFQGLSSQDGHCSLIVVGRTKEPMTQLDSTNIASEESDVSFHPQSGSYVIRFIVAVGETVVPQVVEKLHRIERLIQFVKVIRKFRLNCLHVSLGRVVFRYSENPKLSAEISFTGEDNSEMQLILPFDSPHLRMQQLLQKNLNTQGLEQVIKALRATLPVLITVSSIEAALPSDSNMPDDFYLFIRAPDWFRIDYPKKKHTIDLRLRSKRSSIYWHIFDPVAIGSTAGPYSVPDRAVCESIKALWTDEGDGWEGVKTGVAAEPRAIDEILQKCHTLVWNAPPPPPKPLSAPLLQRQQQQQQLQQQGHPPQQGHPQPVRQQQQ